MTGRYVIARSNKLKVIVRSNKLKVVARSNKLKVIARRIATKQSDDLGYDPHFSNQF